MKNLILMALLLVSSTGFAKTLLTCKADVNASQFESITLTNEDGKLYVTIKYTPVVALLVGEQVKTQVIKADDQIISTKYVFDQTSDGQDYTSLVANLKTKQGVLLSEYRNENNSPSPSVQFLKCQ